MTPRYRLELRLSDEETGLERSLVRRFHAAGPADQQFGHLVRDVSAYGDSMIHDLVDDLYDTARRAEENP